MKQNKKTLKIKNKKIILETSDTYGDLNTIVGVATDVAKFATDSLKFWGNMSKFLFKSSWYTFRAKILNNMSQEDYEKALKDSRIMFVNDSDRNISSIDSNISQMLSSAGISDAEINSYMLGLPGYSVIENINASDILTGRAFDKLEDNKVSSSKHRVIDLIIFYMYLDLESGIVEDIENITDEIITKIKLSRTREFKDLERLIIPHLKTKVSKNIFEVFEYLKKTKSGKIMKILEKCLTQSGRTHYYNNIKNENKAKAFFEHAKSIFSSIKKTNESKEKVKPYLTINNQDLTLINEFKEEYNQDVWNRNFKDLIRSFSRSIVMTNDAIKELALKPHKESIQKSLKEFESEREKKIADNGGKDDIKLDRLNGLEKFVCTAGFEVNHYAAEINFLTDIINKPINSSKDIEQRMLSSYTQVMQESGVFESIESEITEFVNKSSNNKYIDELDKKFKDLQAEGDKLVTSTTDSSLHKQYKDLYKFKKKIEILSYASGYFQFLENIFKKNSLDDFKKYAESVLKEKTNAGFLPDNIRVILEKLSKFKSSDIKQRFGELKKLIEDQKSAAEQSIKDAEPRIEALKQKGTGNKKPNAVQPGKKNPKKVSS